MVFTGMVPRVLALDREDVDAGVGVDRLQDVAPLLEAIEVAAVVGAPLGRPDVDERDVVALAGSRPTVCLLSLV